MAKSRDNITQSDEHNARGIELADRGWLDEAMSEFRKAIALDAASAHAHDNLATVLAEKGQLLDALMEYIEAVKADPESATTHHYLATFLAGQGHDLATAEYHRAIELDFEFPDAHLNLGLAYADRGALEDAARELEVAHQQAPDDEMIRHELACAYIDLERYPDAITHLKRIIKAHPEHLEAYVDLGVAYTAQGFYAEAEIALKKGVELDVHDFAAHYQLAALYVAWGRPEESIDQLEVAATIDRDKLRQWLRDDRIFDPLQGNERYAKLAS
jgi:Flp pilus assembly protein TadD